MRIFLTYKARSFFEGQLGKIDFLWNLENFGIKKASRTDGEILAYVNNSSEAKRRGDLEADDLGILCLNKHPLLRHIKCLDHLISHIYLRRQLWTFFLFQRITLLVGIVLVPKC